MANREITNKQVVEYIYSKLKEGEKAFRDKTPTPYHPDTLEGMLHIYGWVREDLRQQLMKADPQYAASQQPRLTGKFDDKDKPIG